MRFNDEIEEKVIELKKIIDNSNPFGMVTYRDSKNLKELYKIVLPFLENNEINHDELIKLTNILIYIAIKYDRMKRPGQSIRIYYNVLNCFSILFNKYKEKYMGNSSLFNTNLNYINIIRKTIEARKSFYNWNLDEIVSICKTFLNEEEIEKYIYLESKSIIITLNDPIEMTDEYLNIIDEVEPKINEEYDKLPNLGFGMIHFYWEIKKRILEEYGIKWRSPKELNNVIFD